MLPIEQKRQAITDALATHQVVIVAGETGSGKSTQLPQICLALGYGEKGTIGHTQPRRLAARSVAARIAEEQKQPLGETVGFKVRFDDRLSKQTRIKLMTDGILLAELQHNRLLKGYSVIIVDEAHERSLNIDFLLGYLKQLLPKRPDLKVIITSATLDHQRFADHFGNAPMIEVSGRTYPVEMRYQPLLTEDGDKRSMTQGIVQAVESLPRQGDILVFLPTEREIREQQAQLSKRPWGHTEILPLFARLPSKQQNAIFHPKTTGRRIILATNVAETSITVPGIRYVIDSGLVRISRYNYKTKVQRLPIEGISQASAKQRAGRCGRVAAGICIRLYSEEDFLGRAEYTEPEILRTNLASVILQMAMLKLGNIADFPFVNPPDLRFIKDGYRLLSELQALKGAQRISQLGWQMARFPIEPRYARMISAAHRKRCLPEVIVITALLSMVDPRERPLEYQQQADTAHQRFADNRSDFLSILKLWQTFQHETAALSVNKTRAYCQQHFLNFMRMCEWQALVQQLSDIAKAIFEVKSLSFAFDEHTFKKGRYAPLHQALLTGLLSHIAQLDEPPSYRGARQLRWQIFPGSGLGKRTPKWIVATELVETQKSYGRCVAQIEPEWLEPLAKHLTKSHYSEPHWQAKTAQVGAFERVTLYGLDIVGKRRVNYGPIDPVLSREIFIRHALVEGEFVSSAAFLKHNRALLNEGEALQHRSRQHGLLIDEQALFAFYDQHLPEGIFNGPTFAKWLKTLSSQVQQKLCLTKAQILALQVPDQLDSDFPTSLTLGQWTFPLNYTFAPNDDADGVTITIPAQLLSKIAENPLKWLVPGLLEEKVLALIKALPKPLRVRCVPAPEYAKQAMQALHGHSHDHSLFDALANVLTKLAGTVINTHDWGGLTLSPHLFFRICVVDDQNKTLAVGRDLEVLQAQFSQQAQSLLAQHDNPWQREGITTWDIEHMPEHIEQTLAGVTTLAYPAWVDQEKCVALQLFTESDKAQAAQFRGVRRLLYLEVKDRIKSIVRHTPDIKSVLSVFTLADIGLVLVEQAGMATWQQVRTQAQFDACVKQCEAALAQQWEGLLVWLRPLAQQLNALHKQLNKRSLSLAQAEVYGQVKTQIERLFSVTCLSDTPAQWRPRLIVYSKAWQQCLDTAQHDVQKARVNLLSWQEVWSLAQEHDLDETTQWLVEEFAIAVFAQALKTIEPISTKKLKAMFV